MHVKKVEILRMHPYIYIYINFTYLVENILKIFDTNYFIKF